MDKKPKILVVDDDPELVQVVSRILRSKLYEVIVAYNGKEGLQKARKEKPDLIILDILMPVMDGFSASDEFKKDKSLSGVPIIALTSFSESLGQPFDYQFDEYVNKPVRPKELLDIVDKHLTGKGFKV
jgi:two-component system alkaline phosphatase synthesis response regulator PhoP